MSTLFKLTEAFKSKMIEVEQVAIDCDGELSDTILQAIKEVEEPRNEKINNIIKLIKNKEMESDALAKQIRYLQGRKKALDNESARCKEYLEYNDCVGFKSVVGEVVVRKSKQVRVADFVELGDEYCIIKREPDKAAIREALGNGESVEGAWIEEVQKVSIK